MNASNNAKHDALPEVNIINSLPFKNGQKMTGISDFYRHADRSN